MKPSETLMGVAVSEAVDLMLKAAWTETGEEFTPCKHCGWREKEPRTLIHTRAGSIGADWDIESALGFVARAVALQWAPSIFGHDLFVNADGRAVSFAVRAPERIRSDA